MSLTHPYFIFIHLFDNYRDKNFVTNRWISITGDDSTVSGQTDSISGQVAINIQDATSTDGDVLYIHDGTFKCSYKLDVTVPALELTLYQNASQSNTIHTIPQEYGNQLYLSIDSFVGEPVNLKTITY